MGGTLALYARRGVRVILICATRGEAGSMDEDCLDGFSSVAERRENELRCAAGKLGLSEVHFLGYRDSGMPGSVDNQNPQALINASLEEVGGKIAALVRQYQPQVVLTFDPIGGYKHPDHIAVHQATKRAFELAGDPNFGMNFDPYLPAKLYFHIIPKNFLRVAVFLMRIFLRDPRHFGRNRDIDLVALVQEGSFPTHAIINYSPVYEAKEAASRCHESQIGGGSMNFWLTRKISQVFFSKDRFMRHVPAANGRVVEKDLFEGIP
jgi:LmbE family N-acetylglucosaminyl deacetylase